MVFDKRQSQNDSVSVTVQYFVFGIKHIHFINDGKQRKFSRYLCVGNPFKLSLGYEINLTIFNKMLFKHSAVW